LLTLILPFFVEPPAAPDQLKSRIMLGKIKGPTEEWKKTWPIYFGSGLASLGFRPAGSS
jgi:hypothetical protein